MGFAIVVGALLAAAGDAAAEGPIVVEIEVQRAGEDVRGLLRRIAGDADMDVRWVAGRKARLATDAIGLERLFASADLARVQEIAGGGAAAQALAPAQRLIAWTIRLGAGARGSLPGAGAAGRHDAGIVGRRLVEEPSSAIPTVGSGTLVVLGLDAAGNEIARGAIVDPRVVRYEGIDANGRYRARRDFLARHTQFDVVLPDDARIVALEIAVPGANGGALRSLARAVVP